MTGNAPDPDAWTDHTLTVPQVFDLLLRTLPLFVLLTLGVHMVIWGFPDWTPREWVIGGLWGCAIYLVSVVVHELLHVVVMLAAGVRLREIRAGVRWKDGVAFVHAGRPLPGWMYRLVLLAPALVLGVIPSGVGLWTGNAAWTLYGFVMLISAIGDFAVLYELRGVAASAMVEDHPSAVGCRVRRD